MGVMIKWNFVWAVTFVIAGCAASPNIPFEGSTSADQQLSQDVYERVSFFTKAQGCGDVEKIKTEIVEYPRGKPGERRSEERWDAFGCGGKYSYQVFFTEDGEGGTYFSISSAGHE